MNSNFSLLNNSKKTIAYINKQLINYPKSEMVLKQNMEKNMYEIIELIFSYSIFQVCYNQFFLCLIFLSHLL